MSAVQGGSQLVPEPDSGAIETTGDADTQTLVKIQTIGKEQA